MEINSPGVVGADNFQSAADNATDADKVGLAMYSDLSQNAIDNGTTSGTAVSAVTGTEVTNYIQAQQAKNKTYSAADLHIVLDNGNDTIKKYYKALQALNQPILDKDFVAHSSSYIGGKETKDAYVSKTTVALAAMVQKLLAVPVPSTAVPIHLETINALSGIEQTLDAYDPANTDSLAKFGTVALVEDYYRSAVLANADQSEYFSVILDPKDLK